VSWHPGHDSARRALAHDVTALPAHVVVPCYSVLTRLRAPHRVAAADAAAVLDALGLEVLALPATADLGVVRAVAGAGLSGGSVYDALVAATAAHHGLTLPTRHGRARAAYDAVGARDAIP